MSTDTSSVSLSDLDSAGVLLRHIDAVAIARETALRAARGDLPGIPAPEDLRLRSDGEIEVAGKVLEPGNEIRRAARLLAALLSHAVQDVTAPATFRLIFARAFATDEAAYQSLDQFLAALAPFSAPDANGVVREVVATWRQKTGAQDSLDVFEAETASAAALSVPPPAEVSAPEVPTTEVPTTEVPTTEVPTTEVQAPAVRQDVLASPAPATVSLRPARDRRSVSVRPAPSRRHSRGLIPALAAAAVVAALASALWFMRSAVGRGESEPSRSAASAPAPSPEQTPQPDTTKSPADRAADATEKGIVPPATEASGTAGEPSRAKAAAATTKPQAGGSKEPMTAPPPTELIGQHAFSPSFASSASGMFYHSGTGPGSAIMRADTDDKGMVLRVTTLVHDRGSNFHPRLSPDGQSLAFDSDRDGERGVYLSDPSGQDVRRISGPGFAAVPSWSPDGRRLAFVRAEDGRPKVWNIWTIDVATGDTTRITSHKVGQPWGAAWFPDGNRIAYSHEDRLIVRTLQGGDVRVFNSPVRGRLVRTPAVSPDGKRIIFQVRRDGAWMLDVPSGSMHRVLEDPSAEEFTWSPDGRRVAYHSRRSGTWGVWVMAPR